ncbi:MAG: hypothetical protein E7416_01260 [Ruminococcaceae bacterium]|nr:hypothetical protein [Oscillospiraceae bacterium]
MNKSLYFKICSAVIGTFLIIWSTAFAVFIVKERKKPAPDIPEQRAETVQKTVKSAEISHYLIHTQDGKVVVYEVYSNGYSKPVTIPDIYVKDLTDYDRKYFENGFMLEDISSLASMIEDFTS